MRHSHSGALNADNGGRSTLSAEHPTSCRYKRPILSIPRCEARQCPQIRVDGIIFFGFGNIRAFRHLLVYSQHLESGRRRHQNTRKMQSLKRDVTAHIGPPRPAPSSTTPDKKSLPTPVLRSSPSPPPPSRHPQLRGKLTCWNLQINGSNCPDQKDLHPKQLRSVYVGAQGPWCLELG